MEIVKKDHLQFFDITQNIMVCTVLVEGTKQTNHEIKLQIGSQKYSPPSPLVEFGCPLAMISLSFASGNRNTPSGSQIQPRVIKRLYIWDPIYNQYVGLW